jgi:hypothetical protein
MYSHTSKYVFRTLRVHQCISESFSWRVTFLERIDDRPLYKELALRMRGALHPRPMNVFKGLVFVQRSRKAVKNAEPLEKNISHFPY